MQATMGYIDTLQRDADKVADYLIGHKPVSDLISQGEIRVPDLRIYCFMHQAYDSFLDHADSPLTDDVENPYLLTSRVKGMTVLDTILLDRKLGGILSDHGVILPDKVRSRFEKRVEKEEKMYH